MKCDSVRKLLPLYCGDDLGEAEARLVAVHLRDCTECSEELERLRSARGIAVAAVRRLKAPASDVNLWVEIEQRIRNESEIGIVPQQSRGDKEDARYASGFWRFLLPLAAAAAFIALIGIGIERNWISTSNSVDYAMKNGSDARSELPIVESVDNPNTTVITFQTDDPHITIAWFFEESPGTERR